MGLFDKIKKLLGKEEKKADSEKATDNYKGYTPVESSYSQTVKPKEIREEEKAKSSAFYTMPIKTPQRWQDTCKPIDTSEVNLWTANYERGEYEISSYKGSERNVVLPAYIGEKKIVKVRDSVNPSYIAIYRNAPLESVVVPKTVKIIEAAFFANVKRVYFEEGSELEQIEPGSYSFKLCLEEANFPDNVDLSGLFANGEIMPEATLFTSMPRDDQGVLNYKGYHIYGDRSLEVYDTREASAVCLNWTTQGKRIDKVIIRSNVKEIILPSCREYLGDFEVVDNDIFAVENGILYQKSARKKTILYINKSRTDSTLLIDSKVMGEIPKVTNPYISTVIIEPKIKISDGTFDLSYVRTVVSKNSGTKLRTAQFANYDRGMTLYADMEALHGLKKNKNIIIKSPCEYSDDDNSSKSTKSATTKSATTKTTTTKSATAQTTKKNETVQTSKKKENTSESSVYKAIDLNSGDEYEYLKRGAENGDVAFMNVYAAELDDAGKSTEACEWFLKAAELGHPSAQYNIANHFAIGRGVDKDIEKALYWYRKAAENGEENAPDKIRMFEEYQSKLSRGIFTQEEIDGDFELMGKGDRELTLAEKKTAIKKFKSLTASPIGLMGLYYIADDFFDGVKGAEDGNIDIINQYLVTSIKSVESEDISKSDLCLYWGRKAIKHESLLGMCAFFSKIRSNPLLESEAYECAKFIHDNPDEATATIMPIVDHWLGNWSRTHRPANKNFDSSSAARILQFKDREENFEEDKISLFEDHLVVFVQMYGTTSIISYHDIVTIEFANNGACMVLRIYDISGEKTVMCVNPEDNDRLYDVFKELQERLPDKDAVNILDNKDEEPDIITTAVVDGLRDMFMEANSGEENNVIFEMDEEGTYCAIVELDDSHLEDDAYLFKAEIDLPDVTDFDHAIYDEIMDLSNAIREEINLGVVSIPSLKISQTSLRATSRGQLFIDENSYDLSIEATIERPYDFESSAVISLEEAERNDMGRIVLSFSIKFI